VLVRPSANRVYAAATPALLAAETAVLDETVLGGRISGIGQEPLGGVPYLTFDAELDDGPDLAALGLLSTRYAVYRREGAALHPVETGIAPHLDEDLVTIPKYAGKTNELFTRLLLNLTLWAAGVGPADLGASPDRARRVRVLDPLCGRGTTLHQALLLGCDASGVDVDAQDLDAHEAHLKTWLRHKRLKHSAAVAPIRRDGRRIGRRLDVSLAADKQAWKDGDVQRLDAVEGDTVRIGDHVRAGSQDVVVADAPYGVRHGARAAGRLDRNPLDLVGAAAEGWAATLRPGGALGLAVNTHVAPRSEVVALLAGAGLQPLEHGPWLALSHRVDAGVHRDVVVARKPG